MAKPKSTIRKGVSKKGNVYTTKKGSGLIDAILKRMGK